MTIQQAIISEAQRQGLDPHIALAVAQRESGFNQAARGAAGEIGIFQLMPGTARDLAVDPYNVDDNIRGGVRYLKLQIDRYGLERGLQAYNGGPGNVAKGTVSAAARGYAAAIMAAIGSGSPSSPSSPSSPGLHIPFDLLPQGIDPLTLAAIMTGAAVLIAIA